MDQIIPVPLFKEKPLQETLIRSTKRRQPSKLSMIKDLKQIHLDEYWNQLFDSLEAPSIKTIISNKKDWRARLEDNLVSCVKSIEVPDDWVPEVPEAPKKQNSVPAKKNLKCKVNNIWEWGEIENDSPLFTSRPRENVNSSEESSSEDSDTTTEEQRNYFHIMLQQPHNTEYWDPSEQDEGATSPEEADLDTDVFSLRAQLEASWPDQRRPYRTPDPPRRPLHLQKPGRSLPDTFNRPSQNQRVTRQQVQQWADQKTRYDQDAKKRNNKPEDVERSSEPLLRRGHRHQSDKHPLRVLATKPQQVLHHRTQILEDVFESIEDDARRNFNTPRVTRQNRSSQDSHDL